jgi:DNA-binding response OmpR family regulator
MMNRPPIIQADEHASQLRVLVVEDTVIVADEIARMARSLGHEVVGPIGALESAMTFASNLDSASDSHIDIALLDVNLNGSQAFPLAELLSDRGVPIIFLTGYARESIPGSFQHLPCLEKPFGLDELERTFEAALGHAGHHRV